ncbi:MAG: Maf family protein, partial [Myxococcota bacterium]
QEKAMHVMARLALDRVVEPCFVLAADTSIFLEYKAHKNSMHDDEIPVCELMGKPQDPAECASFLHRLSGRTHRVGTAVTLGLVDTDPAILETCMCQTEVRFRSLSEQERSDYVATGEGMDKAGGYAIQGLGAGLVDEISGCYDNVVGLPSSRTIALLRRHGAISRWP